MHQVAALHENSDFVNAFVNIVAQHEVCKACGLQRLGHTPESRLLGHEAHDFDPTPADAGARERAVSLTETAYRNRAALKERGRGYEAFARGITAEHARTETAAFQAGYLTAVNDTRSAYHLPELADLETLTGPYGHRPAKP